MCFKRLTKIIQQKFQDRNNDISDIFQLKNDYQEYENSYEALNEFGLSIDYIEPNTFEDQEHGLYPLSIILGRSFR